MRKYALGSIGATLLLFSCIPVGANEFAVTGGTEYMSWREYHPATGARLLEERGLRGFAAVDANFPQSKNSALSVTGRLYFGDVNYDGQLMDGTPWKAVTRYTGTQAEGGLLHSAEGSVLNESLAFVLRGGIDSWERNLLGIAGYVEQYQLVYLRMGLQHGALGSGWSARGGVFMPLYTQEDVQLYDGIQLQPKGRPSLYAGVGRQLNKRLAFGFDYQAYRFDQSDSVLADTNGDGIKDTAFLQPKSELDMYRFSVKYNF